MSKYVDMVGAVSPTARGSKRAFDIIAAMTPPPRPEPSTAIEKASPSSAKKVAMELAPGLLGGAVVATAWSEHRVLGFLLGLALGDSAYDLYKGSKRRALCNVAVAASGVVGSLVAHEHLKWHPALGWLAGEAAGAVATAFVPGSPVQAQWAKLKRGG